MRPTRRGFLKLAMAGGVAMLTASVGGVARAATRAAKKGARRAARDSAAVSNASPASAGPHPTSDAVRKEIENQKVLLGKTLDTIRAFPLAPGSSPAFVFRPVAPLRRRSR